MLVDWLKFIPALLLLLTPVGIFHDRKVHYRPISRDWTDHWAQIFSLGLHTLDLLRAAAGAWLLVEALRSAPDLRGLLRYSVISTQAAVAAVGIVLQAVVCKEPDSANAPFTFLAGLVLGFLPPFVAGFALLMTVVITAGARSPAAFFPILALAVPGMGVLFTGKKYLFLLIITTGAALLPWLISLLFSLEMVITYRARRHHDGRGKVTHSPLR
jgi:hypothetical protein